MKLRLSQAVALTCAIACTFTGSLSWLLATRLWVRSDAGGTVWCRYDAHGELLERLLDTNGDGRPDVAEYYGHGVLLRRDSDRNFNGVTDLIEDFDADTQQPVRSIVDQDYDGTADLLILFRHGEPVVSERAQPDAQRPGRGAATGGSASAGLLSLRNPFGATPAVDSPVPPDHRDPWMVGARADATLVSRAGVSCPLVVATFVPRSHRAAITADLVLRSPRGPPRV